MHKIQKRITESSFFQSVHSIHSTGPRAIHYSNPNRKLSTFDLSLPPMREVTPIRWTFPTKIFHCIFLERFIMRTVPHRNPYEMLWSKSLTFACHATQTTEMTRTYVWSRDIYVHVTHRLWCRSRLADLVVTALKVPAVACTVSILSSSMLVRCVFSVRTPVRRQF